MGRCQGTTCAPSLGLALLWRFEESAGTTALDSSGNGRHGVYRGDFGTPTPSGNVPPLMHPNSLSRAFNINSRHVVVIDNMPPALRPSNDFTVLAWYRATDVDPGSGSSNVGSEIVSGGNGYLLRLRAVSSGDSVRQIEFAKRIGEAEYATVFGNASNFLDGNWHHVAGVGSRTGGLRAYFDGVEIAAAPGERDDIDYPPTGVGFFAGRHGDGQTQWDFGGNIDEVRMYTRALSAAEIAILAQGRNN